MRKAIHAAVGGDVYRPIYFCFFFEFVLWDDFIWDVSDVDVDVFRLLEWGYKVEVWYVYRHESGAFCGYDAVEEDFGYQHISRGCGYFAWVVYLVCADCESHRVLLFFLWSHAADELPVCHVFLAFFWNVLSSDECGCVGWVFLCIFRLHFLGVQIHLQMKCSNFF